MSYYGNDDKEDLRCAILNFLDDYEVSDLMTVVSDCICYSETSINERHNQEFLEEFNKYKKFYDEVRSKL